MRTLISHYEIRVPNNLFFEGRNLKAILTSIAHSFCDEREEPVCRGLFTAHGDPVNATHKENQRHRGLSTRCTPLVYPRKLEVYQQKS
ncbi:hypothetical protein GJAV_G00046430 [Gymnothorax javanicus]|nr:hypothetical protein GJAV_G00046430 [Gymnothorax javanicus]